MHRNSKTAQKVYRPKIKTENTELGNQKLESRTSELSPSERANHAAIKNNRIAAHRDDKIEEEEKTTIPSDSDLLGEVKVQKVKNAIEPKKTLHTVSQVSDALSKDKPRPNPNFIYRARPVKTVEALISNKTEHKSADFSVETKAVNNKTLQQQGSTPSKEEKQEGKECIDEKGDNNSPTIIKSIRVETRPRLRKVDGPEKSETGVVEREKLVGPYADDYADLYYFIKAKQDNLPEQPIANFSSDSRLYFEETPEVKKIAQMFLQFYWEDEKNVEATRQFQRAKHKKEARKANDTIMPSCISFVLGRIDGKQFCFIGLSAPEEGKDEAHLYETLINCVNDLNKKQKIEFVLINGSTANFSKLICALAGKKTKATFRTCAEKGLASFFTKLWMGGLNFFIDGAVNLLMYPFINGEKYGENATNPENRKIKEIKPFVKNGAVVNILEISKHFSSPMIMCCPACQETNPIILRIWQGAKAFYEQNKKRLLQTTSKENPARSSSPLRRSIRTSTSLETLTIFNSANPNREPKVEDSEKWRSYSKSIF